MLGFSTEQLVVFAFVCLVVLGPKKTVEAAYYLGRKARGLKTYLDDIKREFDMPNVGAMTADIKSELQQNTDAMTASLRNAMTEARAKLDEEHEPNAGKKLDDAETKVENTLDNNKLTSLNVDEMLKRISALEHEIKALREMLLKHKIS